MLRMLNLPSYIFIIEFADNIEFGLKTTFEDSNYHTIDLGGNCGT